MSRISFEHHDNGTRGYAGAISRMYAGDDDAVESARKKQQQYARYELLLLQLNAKGNYSNKLQKSRSRDSSQPWNDG